MYIYVYYVYICIYIYMCVYCIEVLNLNLVQKIYIINPARPPEIMSIENPHEFNAGWLGKSMMEIRYS